MKVIKEEVVGDCPSGTCEGGKIIKETAGLYLGSIRDFPLNGTPPPLHPFVSFYCNSCGVMFKEKVLQKIMHKKPA